MLISKPLACIVSLIAIFVNLHLCGLYLSLLYHIIRQITMLFDVIVCMFVVISQYLYYSFGYWIKNSICKRNIILSHMLYNH